jgi:hypothetical protein
MLPSGDLVQQCELQPGHRHTQALVPTLPPGPLTTLPMPSPRHQAPGGRSPRTARRSEEASDSGTHGGGAPPLQRRRVTQLGRAVEGGAAEGLARACGGGQQPSLVSSCWLDAASALSSHQDCSRWAGLCR